ncbi:DUF2267 domain-containing protein [Phytoactinopolyspora halotolerans]|uniref:Putative pterin-4-alpha-carbinolamine dehydratase n=1 Tax=Phytoactinopolyspora halotolerans TaxID=1981512 RepID=A0A6L9SBF8_9ACTN|nr:DUF2267 domain-containing protein [Phytoactinopolyspora halotolerans]NEE01922.1 DUF2267 domain-containing protein [Phytoactinopolyspora halotolerans]
MSVEYQELLTAVSRNLGLDTPQARTLTRATLAVLARVLDQDGRDRLYHGLPGEFREDLPAGEPVRHWDDATFVRAVAMVTEQPPEDVPLRVQTVLSSLAEQDPELVRSLHLPDAIRPLFADPGPGGGITGATGHEAPLTDDEVDDALRRLPYWTGDATALRRTIELPPENLDAVLAGLSELRGEFGSTPHVDRDGSSAELVIQTASVGAVTARDVELARRVDERIDEAGAGIAPGRGPG